MKNSRSLTERINEYKNAGWEICATATGEYYATRKGITVGMAPDGEYDVWLPLPVDAADTLARTDHDIKLERALALNARIAKGEIVNMFACGDCPSAWLDFAGNDRNKALFAAAKAAALTELRSESAGKLYKRVGCKFVRV